MVRRVSVVAVMGVCVAAGGPVGAGFIEATGFRMSTDATAGHVLTCDANGAGRWQALPGVSAHTHHGEAWTGSATRGLDVATDSTSGTGLYGSATATSGTTYGVCGQSDSSDGYGVYGRAPACGVYGLAGAASGTNYGVRGSTNSSDGFAGYFYGGKGVYLTRLGTTNNVAVELYVNDERALHIGPNATSPNIVGGHSANSITAGARGVTISGGGNATYPNTVTDEYGTIGGGVYFYTNSGLTTGSYLAAGSGTWTSVSDRNVKENIQRIDGKEVLHRLASVPISTWSYKTEDRSVRHMGPMAQDLHAAFGLGDSDKSIGVIDADGISMAAIQGLHQVLKDKDAEIADLKARVAKLEALMEKLAAQR